MTKQAIYVQEIVADSGDRVRGPFDGREIQSVRAKLRRAGIQRHEFRQIAEPPKPLTVRQLVDGGYWVEV